MTSGSDSENNDIVGGNADGEENGEIIVTANGTTGGKKGGEAGDSAGSSNRGATGTDPEQTDEPYL